MLQQQIKVDMVTAMKAKDDLRVQTLRGAMAAFTNELVAKGRKPTDEVDDAMAITVLKRLVKQRKDSAEQFERGGRAEMAQKETAECAIIESYLPAQASEEEITKIVKEKMAELGVADKTGVGKLIGAVTKHFGGNADGAVVKKVIESLL